MDAVAPAIHTLKRSLYSEGDKARAIKMAIITGRDIDQVLPVVYGGQVVGATYGVPHTPLAMFMPLTHKQWCGFKNYAELQQAVLKGQKLQGFHLNKTDISSAVAGFKDYWPVLANPTNGGYTGAAATARQFDNTTTGALVYNFTPGGTKTVHMYQQQWSSGGLTSYMIYDRVIAYDAEVISNATVTMTNTLPAQRYISAGQPGLCIMVTGTTVTPIGATASTLTTLNYTDQGGAVGAVPTDTVISWKTTVAVAGTSNGANVVLPETVAPVYSPFLPLAPADTGVQTIVDYTSSANNTGSVCMVLCRPFGWVMETVANVVNHIEFGRNFMALDRIYDGACLSLIVNSGGQNVFGMDLKMVWG